jgi:phosphatidylglycerol---prolipoprotein diacylglyceryl transferase
VYPVLFRIGSFEVTSFGVSMAVAALVGLWLFRRELQRSGLPPDAADAGLVGVVGGLSGAKVLWTIEHASQGPVPDLLFSRGGLSWYGGLIGGVGAGLGYIVVKGWPVIPILSAATPALAFGHLIGRIGCFLVGDDYGIPSNLPWAVAFPDGLPPTTVPVHPTQLYEAVGLGLLGWLLLRWRRRGLPDTVVLGRYLVAAGSLRFVIEFIRVHEEFFLGLAVAHVVSLAAIAVGIGFLAAGHPTRPRRSGVTQPVTRFRAQ